MNDASNSSWSAPEHFDPMGAPADHDFGNLLDFENIDLDFGVDYSQAGPVDHDSNRQLTELADTLDLQHLQSQFSPQIIQEHSHGHGSGFPHANGGAGVRQHHLQQQQQQQPQQLLHHHQHPAQQQQQQQQHQHAPQNMSQNMSQSGNGFFDFGMQQYNHPGTPTFSQPQEQAYRPHAGVPPTPNSIEMHGDPARYLQQMDPQQALFDQRFLRKDETFTPLVSPAVTPHDARFQVPDFTVPGAYFSPLTSPALNAQTQQHPQNLPNQYHTSGSSTGASPIDVDMDLGESAMAQPEPGRKLRSTKRSAPRSSSASSRVRQSPIVKPGRWKATVSSLIPPKEVSELVEEAQRSRSRPSSKGLGVPHSGDSSELSSVSPEPLTEMGPPPLPNSVTSSPAIRAQINQKNDSINVNGNGVCPATPASLMRLQQSPSLGESSSDMPATLDDFSLPEATLERPPMSRMDTAIHDDDDQTTPRIGARKTPKLGPLSTPGSAMLSSRPSPMLSAVASPTSPAFAAGNGKRPDAKSGRNTKKRGSISTTLVSPALRPKISPSIKPLLPDGGSGNVTEDTHALLLASKSNYQNILDGTTVPGVVYPTSLSTNLTSKRTSHKIAEQGRRNRINTALLEMQALLPSPNIPPGNANEEKSPESSAAAQSNNSKAAKVESAIDYIKQLQKQCSEKDELIVKKDQEMEALRKELAALKGVSGPTNASTPTVDVPVKGEKTSSSPSSDSAT
ncbi:hypothetical protein BU24DRAFT_457599 [Aaosphaeria arxii CBS 175.79]|uniref:BHLH domain-containing protein n=1 Tax=Aaosphaeria arxii CBS 175.79 TaxID=1450172 RepID=A0A6A5Y8J0_9PLEO|nr:uncharacterized protein BU24DRAFT_457599 [Aaosphaeria arxii CBS 175.79]KAF2021636.1 hypothetical protein BU24DRAFT_457599 [Aaosphaeria arxii CBS 175.79]